MVNNKFQILVYAMAFNVIFSCQSQRCQVQTFNSEEVAVFIRPISVTEILDNEIQRGLLSPEKVEARKTFLSSQIHLSLRILKDKGFTTEQKHYLNSAIKDDLHLLVSGKPIEKSLFINESILPGENMSQFFIAFPNPLTNDQHLTLTLNSDELQLINQSISIPINCCS